MKLSLFLIALIFVFPSVGHPEESASPWQRRNDLEAEWRQHGWLLIPHKANYFFPFTYNSSPHPSTTSSSQYKEAKFQLSFKILMWDRLYIPNLYLYFGYTQLALWQLYDQNRSAPFRDINHEPEFILTYDHPYALGHFMLRQIDLGVTHQSNGTTEPDSRSWNRLYARFIFDRQNFSFSVKPWARIPEPSSSDDNPDITTYLGHGEVTLAYFRRNHVLSVMLRNNLKFEENKGAVEVNYSFPLTRRITGLLQYFNGYGETLIDYNHPVNRISIGLALNEWI